MAPHVPVSPATGRRAAPLAALIVGAGVVSALHVGKLPAAIPVLRESLDLSLLQAGFLLSLVQVAGMLLGLLVGSLADRQGPRRVMLAGLCVLAAGSAMGAVAPGVNGLLASRAVEGLGFLLAVLPAPGLLRLWVQEPRTLSRALGWWGAYMPLGTAMALLAGAPLLAAWGWRLVWAGLAGVTLLAAWALARGVPRQAPGTLSSVAAAAPPLGPRLRRTLGAPAPWCMALGFFMYSGQWLAVVGFLPSIYSQAGYGEAAVGLLSALAAGINMLGNIGAGWLRGRGVRPGVLLVLGYTAMGFGAAVAFGAEGQPLWQYLAVLLFSGLGGLIPGTLFGLAVVLAPDRDTVSTTVGWMQQFSSLGQFLGPPLVAWVATWVGGWHLTWVVTGLCSLAGLLLAGWLQRAWSGREAAT